MTYTVETAYSDHVGPSQFEHYQRVITISDFIGLSLFYAESKCHLYCYIVLMGKMK